MSSNLGAFLAVIRAGEGTADEDGYRRMFGGELFDSFSDHPRRAITKRLGGRMLTSTAAGAYQFLSRTWDECAKALALPDFSPASQDAAAEFLIKRRRALDDVTAGRVQDAIAKCAREWASLPGSPYGQPVRTMAQCLATYAAHGGTLESTETPQDRAEPAADTQASPAPNYTPQEASMPIPALIAALLPTLAAKIPELLTLATADTKDERKAQATQLAVDVVTQSLGARNAQEATELVQADPAAAATARQAVRERWADISEAGGGGIEGARKADAAFAGGKQSVWKSPSFVVALGLLPLVYMVVGAVVGLFGAPFSEDVRAAIANGIVGLILGGLIGYYYGQSTTLNKREPAA